MLEVKLVLLTVTEWNLICIISWEQVYTLHYCRLVGSDSQEHLCRFKRTVTIGETGIFLVYWLTEGTVLIEVVLPVFMVCFVKQEMLERNGHVCMVWFHTFFHGPPLWIWKHTWWACSHPLQEHHSSSEVKSWPSVYKEEPNVTSVFLWNCVRR